MKKIIFALILGLTSISVQTHAADNLSSDEIGIYRALVNYFQEDEGEMVTAEMRPKLEDASKLLNSLTQMSAMIINLEKAGKINAEQAKSYQTLALGIMGNVLVSNNIRSTSLGCEGQNILRFCSYDIAVLLGKPEICAADKDRGNVVCEERATATLARDTVNVNLCKGMTTEYMRDDCLAGVAVISSDVNICDMMTTESGLCIVAIAERSENPKLCSALPDERSEKQCVSMVEYYISESEKPQIEDMLTEIKKQVSWPDEDPMFMEITDIEVWRESGDAIVKKSLQGAQNGDFVLFFEKVKKILVYSVSKNKVLYFESY